MLRAHEPARLVGADRNQRDVEAASGTVARGEALVDVGEVLRVGGVAGEEQLERGREDGVAAPQRLHPVAQRSPRPVLRRREDDLDRADVRALPPVELDGVGDAEIGQPGLDAERHDEERRAAACAASARTLGASRWS